MKKSMLKKFAKLTVKAGVNVQKGQDVIINTSFDQVEFVEYVIEECYKAGARKVTVNWNDTPMMTKLKYKYESMETLTEFPEWRKLKNEYRIEKNPALIHILSEDPDGLKGCDFKKMAEAKQILFPITKPYRDRLENRYQWTIIGVPSVAWAKKVFPELSPKKAVEALWDAILKTTRVTDDPLKAWDEHNKDLQQRCDYLNSLNLDHLEYKSSNGTDFKVWFDEHLQWLGGAETSLEGVTYNPNMPTEECFTSPIRGRAEGTVVATKPLSYNGQLIENFQITFKDGKAVSWKAEKNEELLGQMINMDGGSCYLGECALVPFESPINTSGILFYNTLYDENATCHLALGMGFTDCVKDYHKYTKEDFEKMGVNDSMIHVDFMIGSRDLDIKGVTRDGKEVQIFKNGTWAF